MDTESVGLKTIVAILALVPSIGLLVTVVYMVGIFRAQIHRNTEEDRGYASKRSMRSTTKRHALNMLKTDISHLDWVRL